MDKSKIYEIIEGCKKNDRNSQRLLFELYSNKMMGVCQRYCNNKEVARDLVHDGFIKVFTKFSGFKGDSSVETWMTRIFINTCLSHLKKSENRQVFMDIDENIHSIKDDNEYGDESEFTEIVKNMPVSRIFDYINSLPEKYKIVLNMYSVDGFTHQQISETLGIQVGSSKSRLSRARTMLIENIKRNEN